MNANVLKNIGMPDSQEHFNRTGLCNLLFITLNSLPALSGNWTTSHLLFETWNN